MVSYLVLSVGSLVLFCAFRNCKKQLARTKQIILRISSFFIFYFHRQGVVAKITLCPSAICKFIVAIFLPFAIGVKKRTEAARRLRPGKRCTTCREQKEDGKPAYRQAGDFLKSFISTNCFNFHIQTYAPCCRSM